MITELLSQDAPSHVSCYSNPKCIFTPALRLPLEACFCQVAGQGRQLIVETHSDHLLDRVRMDVRDGDDEIKA